MPSIIAAGDIRAILLSVWDPLCVTTVPQARDEYDGYVAGLSRLLSAGADEKAISAHLLALEVAILGAPATPTRTLRTARALVRCRMPT